MEVQQLRHFLTLVEIGNFVRAAEELKISQPGLSRSIKALEASLKVPLFERSARGVHITENGNALIPRARTILSELERASAEAGSRAALQSGQVTIGVSPVFNYLVTPDVIREVRVRGMGIDLHIVSDRYEAISDKLERAEVDFAFLLYGPGQRKHLNYESNMKLTTKLFARAQHPLHGSKKVTIDDLANQDWILPDAPGIRGVFNDFFLKAGRQPPSITVAPSSLGLLLMSVVGGDLLTMLPTGFEDLPFGGKCISSDLLPAPPTASGGLVTRQEWRPTPAAQAVASLFRAIAERVG